MVSPMMGRMKLRSLVHKVILQWFPKDGENEIEVTGPQGHSAVVRPIMGNMELKCNGYNQSLMGCINHDCDSAGDINF